MRHFGTGSVLVWLLGSCVYGASEAHKPPAVMVIASLGVEAHQSAVEGIQAALAPEAEVRVVDVRQADADRAGSLAARGVSVVVALGSEAARIAESTRGRIPAVYTMVLRRNPEWDTPSQAAPVTIPLDVSVVELAARLKELFPGRTRLGIILNPAAGGLSAAQLQARAQQMGFTVRVAECANAAGLLAALASLKHQADFVWCLPDGNLYNSATIKPLVLAAFENRLPLIGFSESFAKAGAAIGIYPDFREVGVQAGEVARRLLNGQNVRPPEGPRQVKIAVNQSVLRLLGLRYAAAARASREVTILP